MINEKRTFYYVHRQIPLESIVSDGFPTAFNPSPFDVCLFTFQTVLLTVIYKYKNETNFSALENIKKKIDFQIADQVSCVFLGKPSHHVMQLSIKSVSSLANTTTENLEGFFKSNS